MFPFYRQGTSGRIAGARRRMIGSLAAMKILRLIPFLALALGLTGQQPPAFVPVTDAMLDNPDPGDWLMWRRTLNSWGYSPLNQITKANVAGLRMAWTRGMANGTNESTPLVYKGVMYLPNPLDMTQALNAATGDLMWEHQRKLPEDYGKFIPNPQGNRNVAIYGDKIVDTSVDDFLYALDARTGEQAWETRIADYRELSAQHTSGPIAARGKIFSGRGCEPRGGPDACVITAHDAKTGKELWRTRTIPKPGEPGDETWGNVPVNLRRHVGTWMVPSFDPELNLIYIGTSVTSPAPKFQLGGSPDANKNKYLYHNCTLAINADTGKIVWYYQHIVDHWDLDHPFERILVDSAIAPDRTQATWINPKIRPGERRKVITGIPGKTGIIYTLDRATGEFLWARATTPQNVVSNIDGATGEVTVNPATIFQKAGDERYICPVSGGGKNWPAGAYSPTTNAIFMPLQNICGDITATGDSSLYAIRTKAKIAPEAGDKVGTIFAVSVETGKTLWKYEQRANTLSLVTTAGGLVFGGDSNGRFRALDQDTGKVLWEVNLGSPVSGYPVAYSVNGKEYIAVTTGGGAGRPNGLQPELKVGNNHAVYAFALP
jgi:PQQ-dependent dehydrogenase (methanol/ethanol family)